MRAWPNSKDAWTLERTVLLPLANAVFAKKFAAVVAFHGFPQNLKTNAAY